MAKLNELTAAALEKCLSKPKKIGAVTAILDNAKLAIDKGTPRPDALAEALRKIERL